MVDGWADMCGKGTLGGSYGEAETEMLLQGLWRIRASIREGHVLVIGSERPWIEACLVHAGAREITTLEYGKIQSEHAKVRTMIPAEAREAFANGTMPSFDAVVSFSSVEHTGLGRYGDALNPWGDLQTIARAWCVTRAGGTMLLGVPSAGQDTLFWNAHRSYGSVMWSHLAANWDQVSRLDRSAPDADHLLLLFRKPGL
mmetsp:Transcript_2942/g.6688  ORF Transcript_2942/g.6688 Transcript_2942/m.6688 type:complete len:200 (-) Transcript_2942:23-622(-)